MKFRFPHALWKHRELWWRLTEREVLGRYRGSALGIGWSFITPLTLLGVYTFVFSQVFEARWGGLEQAGPLGFAVNLFAGLIVFNLFAECVNRAPGLILANPNYVKKVIFPLEVLGTVAVGSAMVQALTSLVVLIVFEMIAMQRVPITFLYLPIVWMPLILGCLAITWALATLGVFLRDINQMTSVIVSMLMFLSPIFYPMSALPKLWQPLLSANPLAQAIEQTRAITISGTPPDRIYVLIGTFISVIACELSFRLFQRGTRAFADVI